MTADASSSILIQTKQFKDPYCVTCPLSLLFILFFCSSFQPLLQRFPCVAHPLSLTCILFVLPFNHSLNWRLLVPYTEAAMYCRSAKQCCEYTTWVDIHNVLQKKLQSLIQTHTQQECTELLESREKRYTKAINKNNNRATNSFLANRISTGIARNDAWGCFLGGLPAAGIVFVLFFLSGWSDRGRVLTENSELGKEKIWNDDDC